MLRRRLLDRMILRPSRHTLVPSGGEMRVLRGDADSKFGNIACLMFGSPNDGGPTVLKFPGNAGRAELSSSFPLAALSPPQADGEVPGCVWTWNPPGYGQSDGPARLTTYGAAACEFANRVLQQTGDDHNGVFLVGNSMGCCAAIHVASQWKCRHRIRGLILRNPPPLDLVVMRIAERYPLGRLVHPVAKSLHPDMNAIHQIASVEVPIVWIACEQDRLVPVELQSKIFDAFTGHYEQVLLAGLDHNELADETQTRQIAEVIGNMNW